MPPWAPVVSWSIPPQPHPTPPKMNRSLIQPNCLFFFAMCGDFFLCVAQMLLLVHLDANRSLRRPRPVRRRRQPRQNVVAMPREDTMTLTTTVPLPRPQKRRTKRYGRVRCWHIILNMLLSIFIYLYIFYLLRVLFLFIFSLCLFIILTPCLCLARCS